MQGEWVHLQGKQLCHFQFASLLNCIQLLDEQILYFNTIALRKAKIAYNFGLSECNRV